MSDMRMMGAFSGIDMSMIDKIMEAEAAKGVRFTQQKEKYTKSQNAWKDMNTRLDSLYKRLEELQKPENFQSKSVGMTGPENLSVSAGTDAATGNYRVQVQRLATQARFSGSRVDTDSIHTDLDIAGSFKINTGADNDFLIKVEKGDSLRAISDKVNAKSADSGVRSSIVDNRLVFTHIEYGDQPLTVSSEDDLFAADLGLIDGVFTEGKTSKFTIDGLSVERSSNVVDDVIEGLTFTLTNEHVGNESTVLSVTENLDKAAETLQKFVEQYNSTQNFIKSQLSVGDPGSDNNQTGTLVGDGTLMRLQSSMRSMLTSQESHGTSIKGLQDLGVTVDRNGTASFDRSKLDNQVRENPGEVSKFFSSSERITEMTTDEDGSEVPNTRTERKGFSQDMRSFVNQYISSSNGIIKGRRDTYDRMIRDVNQRIERFEERLEMRKDRYIRQFSALDTAMMQAESQMDFMFSQLGME